MKQGRHATSKDSAWAWGSFPSRSQERAQAGAEPERNAPGKKDRQGHCKPLNGPHDWIITNSAWEVRRIKACGWSLYYREARIWWQCRHQESCAGCGKIAHRHVEPSQCPDYHEITTGEQEALDAQIARREIERASWKRARRPVITGRQGYRKKKI
jgi:hypothetical protein